MTAPCLMPGVADYLTERQVLRLDLLRMIAPVNSDATAAALIAEAGALEAFVIGGGEVSARDFSAVSYEGAKTRLKRAEALVKEVELSGRQGVAEEAKTVNEAAPVEAAAPQPSPILDGSFEGAVLAALVNAAEKGAPCPRNADIGRDLCLSENRVSIAIKSLEEAGRIVVERAGPKRRVQVNGLSTLWTGAEAAPETQAAPVVEVTSVGQPSPDDLSEAIEYLAKHGCEITRVRGVWWYRDAEITEAAIIAKADRKRRLKAEAAGTE